MFENSNDTDLFKNSVGNYFISKIALVHPNTPKNFQPERKESHLNTVDWSDRI